MLGKESGCNSSCKLTAFSVLTLEMKWENWCVSDLLYYPQTEENVKKEMEDWTKQADEAKAEGWYLMLHKNSQSVFQYERFEDSRNISQSLKLASFSNSVSITLSQRLQASRSFKFRGWTFHKLFFHHSGRNSLLYIFLLLVLINVIWNITEKNPSISSQNIGWGKLSITK